MCKREPTNTQTLRTGQREEKTAAKRRERKLQGREREKQERADKQTEPPAGPKREI